MLAIFLQQAGGGIMSFLPFLLMFVVFYFFFIRPQSRKQKQEKVFQQELKKGDSVVTNTGIHGRVADFSEEKGTVIIETMSGKIMFERASISRELTMAKYPSADIITKEKK